MDELDAVIIRQRAEERILGWAFGNNIRAGF